MKPQIVVVHAKARQAEILKKYRQGPTYKKRVQSPEYKAAVRNRWYLRNYGITTLEYEAALAKQGGVCAICQRPPRTKRLNVDHNHKTGKVRGLLCPFCNKFRVGSHTIKSAQQVVDYLQAHGEE